MDQIDKFYVKLFISFKYNQRNSHDYKTNRMKNTKIQYFLKIIYVQCDGVRQDLVITHPLFSSREY